MYLGVDGARRGWVCAAFDGEQVAFFLLPEISLLMTLPAHGIAAGSSCFIDMPIGLPEHGERACDREARAYLGKRRSTVFPVPCRKAIYASSYQEACAINSVRQGKKLSIQVWNLAPKIRELDQFLQASKISQQVVESHPELAFAALKGRVLDSSKKTVDGARERWEILERFLPAPSSVNECAEQFLVEHRGQVAGDDVVDALALAVCAARGKGVPTLVFGDGAVDGKGWAMRIGV